jgi:AcrR family transcriptional regulator
VTAARVRLTRDRVLAAAVALADREGAEALTLRRLAEDLGVHPTSLYNHVASKNAILDGVVERLFTEARTPAAPVTWQAWVRAVAEAFRDLARTHPGAFMVFTRRPAENTAAYDWAELGVAAFQDAGFSPARAVSAVRAVSLAILGLALNECPPMGDWVEWQPQDVSLADHPRLREVTELGLDAGAGHWELLIEAIVDGLRPD